MSNLTKRLEILEKDAGVNQKPHRPLWFIDDPIKAPKTVEEAIVEYNEEHGTGWDEDDFSIIIHTEIVYPEKRRHELDNATKEA